MFQLPEMIGPLPLNLRLLFRVKGLNLTLSQKPSIRVPKPLSLNPLNEKSDILLSIPPNTQPLGFPKWVEGLGFPPYLGKLPYVYIYISLHIPVHSYLSLSIPAYPYSPFGGTL